MIEQFGIENFKCFRQVSVPLKALTVLIGPNDTGKSAFMEALDFMTRKHGKDINQTYFWRGDSNHVIRLKIAGGGRTYEYTYPDTFEPADFLPQKHYFPAKLIQLPCSGIKMESEGYDDQTDAPMFGDNGEKLPSFMDFLLRRDRKRFDKIVNVLKKLLPGFEDIDISTPQKENRKLNLMIENGFVIPGDQVSVGVRLLIFFVALAHHPAPPRLVMIEEPENGVHPRRLEEIMKFIRELSTGVHSENKVQVIISTHSPYLLDYVDPDEDQVLVFTRQPDGSRTAEPLDPQRIKAFAGEFLLGEIWFNEEESGLVSS